MKIIAGIVLFNPDINKLIDNINAVENQVDEVFLFDNGSKNLDQIEKVLTNFNCQIIKSKENMGIAYALNRLGEKAFKQKANWLLTLDQDTVVNKDLIKIYKRYINLPKIGQLSCIFKDRHLRINWNLPQKVNKVSFYITSASMVNLKAWKKVGGFDESLFIDAVDNDFCAALIHNGYVNYQINFVGFVHEVGHATKHHFIYKDVYTLNHSAFRRFYIARNNMIIARRYSTETNSIGQELIYQFREIIMILLFENNKARKIKNYLNGIIQGLTADSTRKDYLNNLS